MTNKKVANGIEGGLDAPTRHPVQWAESSYYDEDLLNKEMERVFDICHGCRRCVNLCRAFPTLFDLIDESSTMEVDGVDKKDYTKVVDHCYICDMCFMSKCPYVPPHEWEVDFPHLMLRAKAVKLKKGQTPRRDRLISSTDAIGKLASIPVVNQVVNASLSSKMMRKSFEAVLAVDANVRLPRYHSRTASKRFNHSKQEQKSSTSDKVALFITCYGNYNDPDLIADMIAICEHNEIECTLVKDTVCCGMPKLEIGDLEKVTKLKQKNIPLLLPYVEAGYDLITPMPSCNLMFRKELALMFPQDEAIKKIQTHVFDPCEYLMMKHRQKSLNTDFKNNLGKVLYHAACHQRVQNIGAKTKELLELMPIAQLEVIERCSGHDGVYGVRSETCNAAIKIATPISKKAEKMDADYLVSDCVLAGHHIAGNCAKDITVKHPFSLLREAYNL
ncbi:MAG: Fe-S oxidoreductase [Chromatiales bacterium]|nr:Fe-S oxidoreductase [Chromatiales bacterium]